jgi:hypothetical protein
LLFKEYLEFHGVKAAGCGAAQLMPSLVTTLRKSRDIPLLFKDFLEFHGVKVAGAWCCPNNTIFSEDVEERAAIYL